jgi:hypothetical protein
MFRRYGQAIEHVCSNIVQPKKRRHEDFVQRRINGVAVGVAEGNKSDYPGRNADHRQSLAERHRTGGTIEPFSAPAAQKWQTSVRITFICGA